MRSLRLLRFGMMDDWKWDRWQQDVLDHDGHITIRCGRQVGKSEVVSAKACKFALEHPGTITLIIAASQRQSSHLFEKVKLRIDLACKEAGKELYESPPTQSKAVLVNGSRVYSLPAGRTGFFIRCYTIDLLIADEAAYIPEMVWNAAIPMLMVSKKLRKFGWIILLSTPYGKGGYFYRSFGDDKFRAFHVSSEECPRADLGFLKQEKERMSKEEYRQEYLGEFTDDWHQFFPTELIKSRMTFIEWSLKDDRQVGGRYYLGVDIARYGGDENAFVVCELTGKRLRIVKCFTTDRVSTTDTIGRIIKVESVFKFNRIFVDDAGVGGAVTDILMEKLGRKVIGLNNASKRVEIQGEEKKKGILKEDLYSNALMLLETGHLELISDRALLRSLRSITFEYTSTGQGKKVKIYGDYAHLAEAMVRACWCIKERGLSLYRY